MFRMTKPAVAGLALAALAACAKKDNAVDTTAAAVTDTTKAAAATTVPDSTKMAPAATSKWNTPTLLGYALVADIGEVEMGKLGEKKATNPEVKKFAKEMVTDHSKMLTEDRALVKKLNAQPDTTADDVKDLINHGRDAGKDLTDKAKGADWDKNYMDKMIDDHQNVIGKLQDAAKTNTDSTITKALSDATAHVQEHLTKAQAIRAKLP